MNTSELVVVGSLDDMFQSLDHLRTQPADAKEAVIGSTIWKRGTEWTRQATIAAIGCLFSLAPLGALEYMAREAGTTAAEVVGKSSLVEQGGLIAGPLGITALVALMMLMVARGERNRWYRVE